MDKIDTTKIVHYLWNDPGTRKRIEAEHNLGTTSSADEFSRSIIQALKQPVKSIFREVTNREVFEAAVKALGSNSRQWSAFLSKEHELRELLEDYDPLKVYAKWNSEFENEVITFFPGQTRRNDVTAVYQWSKKLALLENYYKNYIIKLSNAFIGIVPEKEKQISSEQLLLLICGFCANPPANSPLLNSFYSSNEFKFFGMGYILSSEFLRNLGWNGFKPDRHIKRLFDYWYTSDASLPLEETRLYNIMLNSQKKDLNDFIKYSLIGHKITPQTLKYSEMDNLLWAFGSYLAKKGKEANFPIK